MTYADSMSAFLLLLIATIFAAAAAGVAWSEYYAQTTQAAQEARYRQQAKPRTISDYELPTQRLPVIAYTNKDGEECWAGVLR